MLRQLSARHDSFALKAPFRISRGVKHTAEVVTAAISQDGITGRGEAAPNPRYGQTVAVALAAIEAMRGPIEAGCNRAALAAAMPPGAARNALDCALWDLEARLGRTSVAALIGAAQPAALASAITIALDTPARMANAAARAAQAPLLKVKVGRHDAAVRIAAVRSAAPGPRMIVDPNESWTMAELAALQDVLLVQRVDLLEQPLPASDDAGLAGFVRSVPICADESAHVAGDVGALAGRYDVVNIKLDKTGGLTDAIAMAEEVARNGLGLMVGCMICSSLAIAPAMQIARDAAFVDLDGPLWLKADYPGGVTDHGGILTPPRADFWGQG